MAVAMEWHQGEEEMHRLLHVPHDDNPTQPYLTPMAANILIRSPLVALGTLDAEDRPWTTLWGGEAGFSQPVASSIIGLKATVDRIYDPVLKRLLGSGADGEVVQERDGGKMVSGLAIDLQSRRRVKLYGKSVAGAVQATDDGIGQVQLVVKIEQSLGNCPKYLNKKQIVAHVPKPELVSQGFPLPQAAIDLLEKADLFFISSSNHHSDMDTNHRGGPPGFVRLLKNDVNGLILVYPEYSGNRLYQTLGNLRTTPSAGLVIPNFDTGDVLYVTGKTEILTGKAATDLLAHTNIAVKIDVQALKYVSNGLSFRAQPGEPSPYNPPVRYLATEKHNINADSSTPTLAKLIDKQPLTPTINRYRFHIATPNKESVWKPGQYVALSFADELDIGYSHMRDDDPKSLNDDWSRTFTVTSRQGDDDDRDQFEITIRNVGPVTDHLSRINTRTSLEVPILGFGGEFFVEQETGESVGFIAGGVGITPLLAQAKGLNLEKLSLYWTVKGDDIGLVKDTFERLPGLVVSTKLFVTGKINEDDPSWKSINASGSVINRRRMMPDDFEAENRQKWYICAATSFRNLIINWLSGKQTFYEDFNY